MSQYFNEPTQAPAGPARRGTQKVLNTPALISMILGIISVVFIIGCGVFLSIPGLILGLVGLIGISASKGRQSGMGFALTGLILSTISLGGGGYFMYRAVQESEGKKSKAYKFAEDKIDVKSGDQIGFGNNAQAEKMAGEFAIKMKLMRSLMFTGADEDDEGFSASGGEFLTFCQLNPGNPGSCAFMVHVPKLRNYESDAQDSMCDLAWTVANGVLAAHEIEEGIALAVGTKGFSSFHRIDVGKHLPRSEDSDDDSEGIRGVEDSGDDEELIYPFFPKTKEELEKERAAANEDLDAADQSKIMPPRTTN